MQFLSLGRSRDTGARHSFIVQSVLPFSSDTQSGDFIVMRGMELGFFPVPRHDVVLDCDLAKGVFSVGVRPELPLPGVSMILGNYICGGRVWPSGSLDTTCGGVRTGGV